MSIWELVTTVCGCITLRILIADDITYFCSCAALGVTLGVLRGTKK